LEEPVWPPEDWVGLARVRAEGGIALAAGENTSNPIDFKHMFDAGAVTYAQPSVTKIGGVSALREVAMLAEAASVTLAALACASDPVSSPRSTSWPRSRASRWSAHLRHARARSLRRRDEREERHGGAAGPGLGVDPDPAVIARYRTA
jgi:L-alanine-DL-glutamate epimerase-like enolase superfamily enzyme